MTLQIPATSSQYWAFRGGLDQVSPPLSQSPGLCRSATNVEVGLDGGLVTLTGYEAFDGRPKPSDAVYYILPATMTDSYSNGDTLTGATSGATAVIIGAVQDEYFVVTKLVGSFTTEVLNISGSPVATSTGAESVSSAATPALNATYLNLAADLYRDDIGEVPGSGSVLGVWKYAGNSYAIRNNAGGTAAVMHVATSSGWTAVALGREIAFTSGGTTEIAAGDTITGATSSATAVITKVILVSGSWTGGDATGRLFFASQTGTFQAENLNVGASTNLATIAGDSTAITLAPSGRYEFINNNFGGTAGMTKMYGVSGVHRGFEFDGTTFVLIDTGMSPDTPQHVKAHKNHLFYNFDGSVQHSGIGTPYSWTVVTGASEIAVGDYCTGFLLQPGGTSVGTLVIYTRNATWVLYGNNSGDWNLVPFNPDAGAIEWSQQYVNQGIALDDRGITLLATSQNFGNFASADVSTSVKPFINSHRSSVVASCVVREKNQYRLFFQNGAALYVTFIGNKVAGLMPIALSHSPYCVCSLEADTGAEEVFFGATDGFVYQMERGTSHNGEPISWSAELAFNHFKSPRQLKTFRKAVIEVSGAGYAQFSMGSNIGYGKSEYPQSTAESITTNLSSAQWDSFVWDQFYWDGQTLIPAEADLDGTAENISLIFSGSSDEYAPITLNGAIVDFTTRRQLR